ncbi:MAG: BlaI/MecI/CopY family transcriptional regulator [Bacteroidetes bacterium]|nr:BlaI/MecI/CopY family transcriptional regulator [Bacteroidota bacterium]
MERLTPSEEQVMLRLWKLQKAAIKDIVELYPDPRPAYNTTSTIIRILERKKFVKHKPVGRGYIYMPRISKESYREYLVSYCLEKYFDGEKSDMIEFVQELNSTSYIPLQKRV